MTEEDHDHGHWPEGGRSWASGHFLRLLTCKRPAWLVDPEAHPDIEDDQQPQGEQEEQERGQLVQRVVLKVCTVLKCFIEIHIANVKKV